MSSTALSLRRLAPAAAVLGVVLAIALIVTLVVTHDGTDESVGGPPPAGSSPSAPASPLETPLGTQLTDFDTATVTVQRAGFCDLVAPEDVEAALDGPPSNVRTYGNGESATITSDLTDIAHEYGCRWKRGGTALRAWVFAPPVTPADADRLVAEARGTDGCAVRRDAPAYGAPSLARTCPVGKGFEASYRGLFGDAWLACSLTTPGSRQAALARAGSWCVAVAEAAGQPAA